MTTLTTDLRWLNRDTERAQLVPLPTGQAAVVCRARPEATGPNEDAAAVFALHPQTAVLAVADGMGGGPAGHQAAAILIDRLRDRLQHAQPSPNDTTPNAVRAAILDAIEQANRDVLALGLGAATTALVTEINTNGVRTYHAGDSAALVVGQKGKLKLRTVAHSPVGFAQESGVIDDGQAMHHQDRHLVSNIVGMTDLSLEVGSVTPLAPRDTLVMGSDGLFDNLTPEEITDIARRGPLADTADRLAHAACQRMVQPTPDNPSKPDDLTLVLYRPARPAATTPGPAHA